MAKFIFTESQLESIKRNLSEDYPGTDNNYKVGKCEVNLYGTHNLTYKGHEVDEVSAPQIEFTFDIDMDIRSYGIRGISVFNPKGPSEIELEVFYNIGEDETNEETITLPLDWSSVNEDEGSIGWIGYDNQIDISLKNDENGNIVIDTMTLFKNSI
jgi:hypothetical protein